MFTDHARGDVPPTLTEADEWAGLRGEYLHYVTGQGRKRQTAERYANLAEMFYGWCMYRGGALDTASAEDIARYLQARRDKNGAADSTIINHIVSIRWLFRLLIAQGHRSDDPSQDVEAVSRKPRSSGVLAEAPPWLEAFRVWLRSHGRAKATVRRNIYAVSAYARWCRGEGIDPVMASEEEVARFSIRESDRVAPRTALRNLTDVKNLYAYFVASGKREDDPAALLKLPNPSLLSQEPFTQEELRRLLAHAETARDRALLLTFAATGCRLGEVAGMITSGIDWETGILLVTGKGLRQRRIALGRQTVTALSEYLGDRTGDVWMSEPCLRRAGESPLTPMGIYFALQRIGKRAGVEHVHPHRFRTSFANTFAERSGGDLQTLQVLLGHAKIETTAHYARWGAAERAIDVQRQLLAEEAIPTAASVVGRS